VVSLQQVDDRDAVFRIGVPDGPAPLRNRGVPRVSFRHLHHVVLSHRSTRLRQHDPRPLMLVSPKVHVRVLHLQSAEPLLHVQI
jgi:hypothetical protein